MGKSSFPQPPDPNVLAGIQGNLNNDSALMAARLNRPNQSSPFMSSQWTPSADGSWWSNRTEYDPRITNAYFNQLQAQGKGYDLAGSMADAVRSTVMDPNTGWYKPFDPSIPAAYGAPQTNDLIGDVDLSGVSKAPDTSDYSGDRQKVEDAMYGRQTARLDPQYQQRQSALETQLMNQGFARGSEGWDTAMANLGREREQAYSGARNDAITGGGQEQSRMFSDAMAGRQQGVGEQFQRAGFYNTAAGQDYGQRFQQGQFGNAIRSQRFGEELAKRNQSFNEFAQLLSGAPTQTPQLSNPTQIQGPQAPDYTSAALGAYGGQQQAAAARQGNKNASTGAGAGIASAAIAAY